MFSVKVVECELIKHSNKIKLQVSNFDAKNITHVWMNRNAVYQVSLASTCNFVRRQILNLFCGRPNIDNWKHKKCLMEYYF